MPSPIRIFFLLIVPAVLIIYGGVVVYNGWFFLPTATGYVYFSGLAARLFGASAVTFGIYAYLEAVECFSTEHSSGGEPRVMLGISVVLLIVSAVIAWPTF